MCSCKQTEGLPLKSYVLGFFFVVVFCKVWIGDDLLNVFCGGSE